MCEKAFLILFLLLPFGALKAQSTGCTDVKSPSYNASATINDGSCTYGVTWFNPTKTGTLPTQVAESSGLVFWDNLLWTNNDSDSEAEIYGIDPLTQSIVRTVKITNAPNIDWEDMTIDETHLYIGDIGNNLGNRKNLRTLKIPLEQLKNADALAEIIEFEYEDQTSFEALPNNNNFDAEALVSIGDSLYIFTKNWVDLRTRLYVIPKIAGQYKAKFLGEIYSDGMITGASFNPTNNSILLVGYNKILQPLMWLLWDYPVKDFFGGNKRKINLNLPLHQVEAITWIADNQYYITNETFRNIPSSLFSFNTQDWISKVVSSVNPKSISAHQIYPNPAQNMLFIEGNFDTNSTIRIYNEVGQQVIEEKISSSSPSSQLNISTLNPGIYSIVVTSNSIFEVGRFVKGY